MSDGEVKEQVKGTKGVPLFDKDTMVRIIQEATASGNMAEVARKYGTSEHNVYRWVRNYKMKQGKTATPPRPKAPAPDYHKKAPEGMPDTKELYAVIGRLTLEVERLSRK